jgi:hypothetical protein
MVGKRPGQFVFETGGLIFVNKVAVCVVVGDEGDFAGIPDLLEPRKFFFRTPKHKNSEAGQTEQTANEPAMGETRFFYLSHDFDLSGYGGTRLLTV